MLVLFLLYLGYMAIWQAIEEPIRAGRIAAILAEKSPVPGLLERIKTLAEQRHDVDYRSAQPQPKPASQNLVLYGTFRAIHISE